MLKILFLCTGNSCRSQMAEGWARHLKSDLLEPYSAGIETHGLNPNAVAVMREAGIDITSQTSQHLDELSDVQREVVLLHDLEGWKHREIAERLELPSGTVRSHLHFARKALRNLLDGILTDHLHG